MSSTIYLIDDNYKFVQIIKDIIVHRKSQISYSVISDENPLLMKQFLIDLTISDFDLFLLDVDLKTSFTGIDLAKIIRTKNRKCSIAFLTSYDSSAIEILNSTIQPIGFIVKQVNINKLENDIDTVLAKFENSIISNLSNSTNYISLCCGNEKIFVESSEIILCATIPGARKKILVKTDISEYIVTSTIKGLSKKVGNSTFLFSLQSYILNLTKIEKITRSTGEMVMIDGTALFFNPKTIDKVAKALNKALQLN